MRALTHSSTTQPPITTQHHTHTPAIVTGYDVSELQAQLLQFSFKSLSTPTELDGLQASSCSSIHIGLPVINKYELRWWDL
jgi:hypothetical protein